MKAAFSAREAGKVPDIVGEKMKAVEQEELLQQQLLEANGTKNENGDDENRIDIKEEMKKIARGKQKPVFKNEAAKREYLEQVKKLNWHQLDATFKG